jgi:hypothetical protein
VTFKTGSKGFLEWVDRQSNPGWKLMPLTHISKGLIAEDIIRTRTVDLEDCDLTIHQSDVKGC